MRPELAAVLFVGTGASLGRRSERANQRHAQAISHPTIDGGAKKDLCLIVDVPPELLHQNLHFRKRHARNHPPLERERGSRLRASGRDPSADSSAPA